MLIINEKKRNMQKDKNKMNKILYPIITKEVITKENVDKKNTDAKTNSFPLNGSNILLFIFF